MFQKNKKNLATAEYIWLDGAYPTQELRSKARILSVESIDSVDEFPTWGFDGSSTDQATGDNSDCELKPVYFCPNPFLKSSSNHYFVLCEVFNSDGTPHKTNTRCKLRDVLDQDKGSDSWVGFEQEYTLFEQTHTRPLGWPLGGFPAPQGPFYCGVGANRVFGRSVAEEHMEICCQARLCIFGINAEVMPGQWEYQIGYRGVKEEKCGPLTVSDQAWMARYLLKRVGEKHAFVISFANKPISGDWNGAGMHTNFSTNATRDKTTGLKAIEQAIKKLKTNHQRHITDYGHGLDKRLTGTHETSSIDQFKSGISDRGSSIRIPLHTSKDGHGYFEDRRPGANADPYLVTARLVETVCLN